MALKIESKKSAKCVASAHQCQLWPAVVFFLISCFHILLCVLDTHTHTHKHVHIHLDFREMKKPSLARSAVFNFAFMLKSLREFIKNNSIPRPHPRPIKLCGDWASIFFEVPHVILMCSIG